MQSHASEPAVINIHGPIISSSNAEAHLALFEAFGMREVGRLDRTATETTAIWGTKDQASSEIVLETPGTPFGLRLVRFVPGLDVQIRDPSRGSDADALKVIDFYAPDLAVAIEAIETKGFRFKPGIADYETPEGRFQEGHLWGPDGVVCALLSGEAALYDRLATVRDRLVSEPQSISGPVRDAPATLAHLKHVLGLDVIHRYGLDDQSFDALVGTNTHLKLRAWNVGVDTAEPYLGIIDYGLPVGTQTSLIEVARPPARGLLGVTLRVEVVAVVAERAGVAVVAMELPGFGSVRSATFQGPGGAWFQALQS